MKTYYVIDYMQAYSTTQMQGIMRMRVSRAANAWASHVKGHVKMRSSPHENADLRDAFFALGTTF